MGNGVLMRSLFLALLLASQLPAAISMSNVYATWESHGTFLVNFTVSGTTVPENHGGTNYNVYWKWLKVCWSTTAGQCATDDPASRIMPTQYQGDDSSKGVRQNSDFSIILTGLPASSNIEFCPMVSQDNATWVTACGTTTTLGAPAQHPVAPEPPRNVTVPTAPSDYSGYHTSHSNGDGLISGTTYPTSTCANLQSDMDYAQSVQATYGTVIALAPGQASKCGDRFFFRNNPPDVHTFGKTDVRTSDWTINWPGSGLTEGHGVQFSHSYSVLPGEFGTNPNDCQGIKPGQVYYAHFQNIGSDPDHFQLTCDAPYPKGRIMHFQYDPSNGGSGNNMFVAQYPRQLFPIILRTSTPDSQLPPPGTRINPSWEPKLAVIQPEARCPGFNCQYKAVGVRKTSALAFGDLFDDSDYRMPANTWGIGLEIQSIDATGDASFDPMPTWNLVEFKQGTSDNFLDRCYIHGQYPFPSRLAWGIIWDGHNNGILNSYFDRITYPFHGAGQTDSDSSYQTEGTQFIQAATGPGPYIFYNNSLQTTGNGMHFNGAGDGGYFNTYAQDILIRRNTYTQNPQNNHQGYCSGNPGADAWEYRNRQALEFKGGWRILIDGNIFEYDCHFLASSGIALTSVAGGIFDVALTNNTWRHMSSAAMGGSSTQGGQMQLIPTSRYMYRNNLFFDIDGCKYIDHQSSAYNPPDRSCWNGYIIQTVQDGEDFIWDHNTVVSQSGYVPSQFYLASGGVEGFQFTNSIAYAHSDAGTAGAGFGARVDGAQNQDQARTCNTTVFAETLLTGCNWKYPGAIVAGNLFNSDSLTFAQLKTSPGYWANQNATATPSDLSLVNWQNTTSNFRLKNSSVFISGGSAPATDKLDVGANIDQLERAQGKVYLTSAIPASTTATINFVAPDSQGCSVDVSSTDSTLINSFTRFGDTGGNAGPRAVGLTGLTAKTDYFFRINCAVEQPTGTFHTN
jgi:hypothetical protein